MVESIAAPKVFGKALPANHYGNFFLSVGGLEYEIRVNQELQHAIKKLLVAGGRGAKDATVDVEEAIEALERWKEMRREDANG